MNRDLIFGFKLIVIAIIIALLNSLGFFSVSVKPLISPLTLFFGRQPTIIRNYTTALFNNFTALPKITQDLQLSENNNLELQSQLSELKELQHENRILREQLGFIETIDQDQQEIVSADVVGEYRYLTGEHYFIVNKGSVHGVANGLHVLDKNYYLGTVSEVNVRSARVDSLLSKGFSAACIDQETRTEGVCRVDFGNNLEFSNLAPGKEVAVGDFIVTSGKDGKFPRGFMMGEVSLIIGRAYEIDRKAHLEPFVSTVPGIVFINL